MLSRMESMSRCTLLPYTLASPTLLKSGVVSPVSMLIVVVCRKNTDTEISHNDNFKSPTHLASAVVAKQSEYLVLVHLKAEVVHRHLAAIRLPQTIEHHSWSSQQPLVHSLHRELGSVALLRIDNQGIHSIFFAR
jgi:hypothetical protein